MSLDHHTHVDQLSDSTETRKALLKDLCISESEWKLVTLALSEQEITAVIGSLRKYPMNPGSFEDSLLVELGKTNGQKSQRRTQLLKVIQSVVDRSKANRKQLGEQTRNRGAEQFHQAFLKKKEPSKEEPVFIFTDGALLTDQYFEEDPQNGEAAPSVDMTVRMERPTFIVSEEDLDKLRPGPQSVSGVEEFLEARADTVEIQSLLNKYPEITEIWKAIKAQASKPEREIMKQVLPHAVHYYEIRRPRDINYIKKTVTPILYNYSESTRLPLDTLYEMIGQLWITLRRRGKQIPNRLH